MPDWMLEAPLVELTASTMAAFEVALDHRNPALLPPDVPRWVFLQWLASRGYLLHGSPQADLTKLHPLPKNYKQPDEFSNTVGVYAASDGLWAMMYALRGPGVARQNDMGLQKRVNGEWSRMKYFLSVAPRDQQVTDGYALLAPGVVYVLERTGFKQSPPYEHPGLGFVQEAHWVNPDPVTPLMSVPVHPEDFPLPVRVHDADRVDALCAIDPWGFPWLSENEA